MIKYGSIDQYRNIVKTIQWLSEKLPAGHPAEFQATLTEKIHGTNASVCFSEKDGLWVQSKNNIITPENDNAGCAAFVEERRELFIDLIRKIANIGVYGIDLNENIVTLYFEWCGGNIQKNSCVSGLDKRAIFFNHFKVSGLEEEVSDDGLVLNEDWLPLPRIVFWEEHKENNLFHVSDFGEWKVTIDPNAPGVAQNQMVQLVEDIEAKSPIGLKFGEENIGEGVVGIIWHAGEMYRFKVKGDKHSKTKVKKLNKADTETEAKINDFAQYACPAWRLEQAWQTVFGIENEKREPTVKATGNFLRAVHQDIIKEEIDVLQERGLTTKQVNAKISKIAREWFMEQLDKEAGL